MAPTKTKKSSTTAPSKGTGSRAQPKKKVVPKEKLAHPESRKADQIARKAQRKGKMGNLSVKRKRRDFAAGICRRRSLCWRPSNSFSNLLGAQPISMVSSSMLFLLQSTRYRYRNCMPSFGMCTLLATMLTYSRNSKNGEKGDRRA